MEKKSWGIHVSVVAPGGFRTNIANNYADARNKLWARTAPDVREVYGKERYDKGDHLINNNCTCLAHI